ncbi:MAG: response regulator [Gammaproteobacteria bacterium]|jgi:DNA-binding response OmpR family regulator|nr:response regulator [Gammaproteobacteria bacterium]MDH3907013.1 response regulator [Gammaproteobacteria bacterium]MDH4006402.1 response regulator [Gammaproteobacteria bacterium]
MDAGRRAGHASDSHLLVVDDDSETRELLSLYLGQQGFDVAVVEDGEAMDAWLADNVTDLVILDLMLPGEDGLSIARRLRSDHKLPIVMISARGEELDRIVGLEVGADDYLPKPFNPRELLARIRAVLRRSAPSGEPEPQRDTGYRFGDFRFDGQRRVLYRGSDEVDLSRAEFDLLQVLVHRPNRVLSRDFIMDCLGGSERDPFDRSIDVRVTRLRHKIEDDPSDPKLIRTVWGVGYQFTPEGGAS